MTAICFTEHGNIFSWVKKKEYAEKCGLKYIHGAEVYVAETLDEKVRDNKHTVLIAKNYDGVKELNALVSNSFNRQDNHYYYVPRISMQELENTSRNIIVTTACIGGVLFGGSPSFKKRFLQFIVHNKQRCFLEIQHHPDVDQCKYNQYLTRLSIKYGLRLIAGTDTHALNSTHLKGRKVLQEAKSIHFSSEDNWDLTFKTYEELIACYEVQGAIGKDSYLSAIENTNKLAEMIESFELDRTYKYPHLWKDPESTFLSKIEDGIKTRGVDKYNNLLEYRERIQIELEAYRHNGAIDFMLLMEDIVSWCNDNDIKVGYGRGSCNGSVIAWLLGITEMDSIKHKLNFQRFMNVERVSLSDIDTDFPPTRRNDVKNYIFSKTGLCCCDIITFNTIALKGAIRDVGRALKIPLSEVAKICDTVDTEEEVMRSQYPELFEYVDIVNGTVVSVGSHPCGSVTSPHDVNSAFGTFTTSTSEYPISQINMKEIDGLNYVKLDLLALDTIELINETCKLAGIERLTPDNVDVTDISVWNAMRDDTTQIFQWEGGTGHSYIKKLLSDETIKKFQTVSKSIDRMTLLSIGNSAIRPAGASYREDLANGVVRKINSPAIDEFLSNTFGYLVFQEQIIDFLHHYCGFTMGEADIVRRGFAKKTGTEQYIPRIKDGFIQTMTEKYGSSKKKAEEDIVAFIQVIEDASSYLFSLNHSQPYSYEGYVSAYLRYYYPLEFITTALNINQSKEDKTRGVMEYAKSVNIPIDPIRFRHSKSQYSCDKQAGCIYKGMASIKYLNDKIAEELYELKDNQYASFDELLIDIGEKTSVNSKQLEILIKLDFFEEFGYIHKLLKQVEIFNSLHGKKQIKKENIAAIGVSAEYMESVSKKVTDKIYKDFNPSEIIQHLYNTCDYPETSISDKARYELECLGYIQLTIPTIDEAYAYVVDIDGKYKNKIVSLYRIQNGRTDVVKVKGAVLENSPLCVGDMIKTIECEVSKKWGKTPEGEWYRKDETETILNKYSYVK